jgi:hypothetical protein
MGQIGWSIYIVALSGTSLVRQSSERTQRKSVSGLMDLLLIGEDQSHADQPNSLAEGPPM